MNRLICWTRTVLFSVRYWLNDGVLAITQSGHDYGEPTYFVDVRDGVRVRYEDLHCLRCGYLSRAWEPVAS